ncbi:hypothetical protein Salat_2888000 [Sesamum alatum]|uniref:Reverse transcriptase zinc-binding domain-containing protein n=1 Tax=Sesamum alatum TaxID=300844 RepID=A0AAE1XI63_9LAMI|nr:hypothetical protein Salat_2888000 [Sesamum alatum]
MNGTGKPRAQGGPVQLRRINRYHSIRPLAQGSRGEVHERRGGMQALTCQTCSRLGNNDGARENRLGTWGENNEPLHLNDPRPTTMAETLEQNSGATFTEIGGESSGLLHADRITWNDELIHEEFFAIDAKEILKVPVTRGGVENALIWHYESKGHFTVSNTYNLALRLLDPAGMFGEGRSLRADGNGWTYLWKTRVPPKTQLFAWMACMDTIPVTSNLWR